MQSHPNSLVIKTLFESSQRDDVNNQSYYDMILRTLKKMLPIDFFQDKQTEEMTCLERQKTLKQTIPIITYSEAHQFPGTISFFALSRYRPNSFKFFFEMISRWLNPGQRLNVVLVCASDFILPQLGNDVYTICEVMISVQSALEFEDIQKNFSIIGSEISLGIHSEFYAQRILEIKGLAADDKTAMIQGFIAHLTKRFPHVYDKDVFTEMQHLLVTCRDDFKETRQPRHLSRIISVQYLFRKALREAVKKSSHRRHLSLKIFRAFIRTPTGHKQVLSLLVGVNFFRDQETFGEKNLLRAIQHYIPTAQAIENSFFINKLGSENICISYIEIEKKEGGEFTIAEIRKLRRELPTNLKNRVENRLHSVFMPRNEEEIMRNILALTNQIKYVRDIPQVFISFDEQAYSHLYFNVILARVVKPEDHPIPELFKKANSFVEYLHDRTKVTGYVRKRYAKEATVFRLKLPKEGFLRADHSIDLYKARQTVVSELSRVIGKIRDYNGGMISKQHELLSTIRRLLSEVKEYDELLLENFFYSLTPVVVRALLDPKAFKTLFLMLLEGIKDYTSDQPYVKFYTEPYNIFALVMVEDPTIKDQIYRLIQELHIPSTELAYAHVKIHGSICMGYICCARDAAKKEEFFHAIQVALKSCELNVTV
jgi:hypothetical protein